MTLLNLINKMLFFVYSFLWKFFKREKLGVVLVDGGLASQMSQYMLGVLLHKKTGINIKYDLTWFDLHGKDCDGKANRSFQLLNVFPEIKLEIASIKEIKVCKMLNRYKNQFPYRYNESIFVKKNLYLGGYYANWKYLEQVKDEIYNCFTFNNSDVDNESNEFKKKIQKSQTSIAVHIRRGDYVNIGVALAHDYYINAMNYFLNALIDQNPHFFIFSDGMSWVLEEIIPKLPTDIQYTIVDTNDNDNGDKDLMLISSCNHQIISNSGFSLWGAILNCNPHKIVIMPSVWTKETEKFSEGSETAMCFPGWITIPAQFI